MYLKTLLEVMLNSRVTEGPHTCICLQWVPGTRQDEGRQLSQTITHGVAHVN